VSLHSDGKPVLCVDAAELGDDALALDALARIALTARRRGCRILVRHAAPRLVELIALAGLSETLTVEPLSSQGPPPRY
jgi:anti-anti-sigma regulatory factor